MTSKMSPEGVRCHRSSFHTLGAERRTLRVPMKKENAKKMIEK